MGDDVGWADVPWNNRDLRSDKNVVFIIGEDVGWADVPWNNRDLRSANTPDIITRRIYCTVLIEVFCTF